MEFAKGFDERNLRHMRGFFQAFPIWNAVRTELSWTHYRSLLRVDNEAARRRRQSHRRHCFVRWQRQFGGEIFGFV
ncbi:DUF1016 N-terminal domain-containing protein [uncultured Deefgea sp.]|uniref:DUF1016 N-terminal domain-containing protein n=1 Tax=uncultured Deefgea sp. TaxID=1304914 RepID=UPI0035B58603